MLPLYPPPFVLWLTTGVFSLLIMFEAVSREMVELVFFVAVAFVVVKGIINEKNLVLISSMVRCLSSVG